MLDACVMSPSCLVFTGASCDSTAPKAGSTTNFARQHGQVTFRFSPSFNPIRVLYSWRAKKQGARFLAPPPSLLLEAKCLPLTLLCFRGAVSARESRRRAKFRTDHLRVGCCCSLWRRRRRRCPRLIGQRLAFDQQLHFVGIQHFALKKALRDALQNVAMCVLDVPRFFVRLTDDAFHFLVDVHGRGFAEIA